MTELTEEQQEVWDVLTKHQLTLKFLNSNILKNVYVSPAAMRPQDYPGDSYFDDQVEGDTCHLSIKKNDMILVRVRAPGHLAFETLFRMDKNLTLKIILTKDTIYA